MHRGSGTHTPGDPIWMIETIFYDGNPKQYSMFKTFPSLTGFKAGLKAVKDQIRRFPYVGGADRYRTYTLPNPQWQACNDEGQP